MAPLKVRQRYGFPQVYGFGEEVESQQQQLLLLQPTSPLSPLSYRSSQATLWRHRLENVLWIASAAFIVYYGDFRSNLLALLVGDSRIRRTPFNIGLACVVLDVGIFLYLAVRLQMTSRIEDRLEIIAPGAIPAVTIIGFAAFILFSIALWPIWNFLTVPMLFTLVMAFVVVAPYLPPYVNLEVDAESLRCLYVLPD